MDDHRARMLLMEKERFRDNLETGFARLEEARATVLAGQVPGQRPAVERVAAIWDEPDPTRVVDWLYRRQLSDTDLHTLLHSLTIVRERADHLPPRHRTLADRTLFRLLHKLPLTLSYSLVTDCIRGRRKMCRAAGYRALRANGTVPEAAELLWNRHLETNDQQPLELLACAPEALVRLEIVPVITRIATKYYRMRLVESLIRIGDAQLDGLLSNYPIEFAWAAGRVADPALLPRLRAVTVANEHDPECVWSAMWALSQMPVMTEADVERMRHIVVALIEQRPSAEEFLKQLRVGEFREVMDV